MNLTKFLNDNFAFTSPRRVNVKNIRRSISERWNIDVNNIPVISARCDGKYLIRAIHILHNKKP